MTYNPKPLPSQTPNQVNAVKIQGIPVTDALPAENSRLTYVGGSLLFLPPLSTDATVVLYNWSHVLTEFSAGDVEIGSITIPVVNGDLVHIFTDTRLEKTDTGDSHYIITIEYPDGNTEQRLYEVNRDNRVPSLSLNLAFVASTDGDAIITLSKSGGGVQKYEERGLVVEVISL